MTSKNFWDNLGMIFIHLLLICVSFFMLLPILWSFLTSIKPQELINKFPPVIFPNKIVYTNYVNAFTSQPMLRFMINSLFLAICSALAALVISMFSSYAFSRFRFKGRGFFIFFILFTMMMPGITNLIPLYSVFSSWGLLNNYFSLVILYLPGLLPFSIWMMKNFFDSVPFELEEAAFIDGCNRFNVIFKIIMPSAAPGLVAISIINFVAIWNEFLLSMLFTSEKLMRTMTVGIYNFIGFASVDQGAINAAAMAGLIPVLIIFLLLRDKFMKSMLDGAIKG